MIQQDYLRIRTFKVYFSYLILQSIKITFPPSVHKNIDINSSKLINLSKTN